MQYVILNIGRSNQKSQIRAARRAAQFAVRAGNQNVLHGPDVPQIGFLIR
jgi:hypothetical protein